MQKTKDTMIITELTHNEGTCSPDIFTAELYFNYSVTAKLSDGSKIEMMSDVFEKLGRPTVGDKIVVQLEKEKKVKT